MSGTTSFASVSASSLTVSGNATINGTTNLKGTKLTGTLNIVNTASANSDAIGLNIGGDGTGNRMRAMCDGLQAINASGTKQLYLNYWGGIVSLSNGNQITANNGTFTTPTLVATKGTMNNLFVTEELRALRYNIQTIADLGGTFIVAPTVNVTSNTSTAQITAISGNTISMTIKDPAFAQSSIGGGTWSSGSKIKISGKLGGVPIGTCDGTVSSINTGSTFLAVTFTYTGQSVNGLTNGRTYAVNTTDASLKIESLTVMLTTVGATNPIGIYMTSYDTSGYSHISLYGGTTTTPTVRIGNLQGLAVGGVSADSLTTKWGIYTNNGLFDGVIAARQGIIGSNATVTNNWQIGDRMIYYGNKVPGASASTLVISTGTASSNSIGGSGTGSKTWMLAAGTGFGVTNTGALYANSGNIAGWKIEGNDLSTGTWGSDNSAMLCTGTTSAKSIGGSGSISGWVFTAGSKFGVTNTGDLYCSALHANSGSIASSVTIGGKAQSEYLNDNIEIGGRNLLRYTSVPADLAKIGAPTTYWSNVTEDGIACVKGTGNNTMHLFGYTNTGTTHQTELLKANTTYTYSAWIKVNKAGSFHFTSYGHFQVNNSASTASDKTHEDVASARIYEPSSIPANTWTKIRLTFTTNNLAGSTFGLYPVYSNGADVVIYMYGWKLEEGNKATDWTPAPEDVDAAVSDAAKTATNYLTTISGTTGISVHDVGDTSNFVNMNSNGVFVYKGRVQRAQFGETTIIGKPYVSGGNDNESRMEMDYHSFKMIDKGQSEYVHLSDLRNSNGIATIKERINAISNVTSSTYYNLTFNATNANYTITVKDANNNDITSSYTVSDKTTSRFKISPGLSPDVYVIATYNTTSNLAKAFTFGSRSNAYSVGGLSFCEGRDVAASGNYSHAEGQYSVAGAIYSHAEGYASEGLGSASHAEGFATKATGDSSHSEGYFTKATGSFSHASGLFTTANLSNQFVIGKYNDPSIEVVFSAQGTWTSQETRTFTKTIPDYNGQSVLASVKDTSRFSIVSQSIQGDSITVTLKCTVESTVIDNGDGTQTIEDVTFWANPGLIATYAPHPLVIGNGSDDSNRSNALTVDWNGGIEMDLDIDSSASSSTIATSGTDMYLFNAIKNLNWYNDVIT